MTTRRMSGFHVLDLPGPLVEADLRFVKADNHSASGVLVGVLANADTSLKARFSQALGVADGQVMALAVGMMDELATIVLEKRDRRLQGDRGQVTGQEVEACKPTMKRLKTLMMNAT